MVFGGIHKNTEIFLASMCIKFIRYSSNLDVVSLELASLAVAQIEAFYFDITSNLRNVFLLMFLFRLIFCNCKMGVGFVPPRVMSCFQFTDKREELEGKLFMTMK